MKDPCKECIIQVTCTEQCLDKENYTTLIRNAVIQNFGKRHRQTYDRMSLTNNISLLKIYNRKVSKEEM